jgi:ubiquinol-cytochrome c reductase cytochrome b subunit
MAIIWRQKHTNFPERGLRPDHIRGERLWPRYAFKSVGFLFAIWGVLALFGGLVQINPIWLYGPYEPHIVSQAAQPDWYMGWLEGLLRLFPNWQITIGGYEIPELFFPSILIPGLFFTILAFWPWIERRFTDDREAHDLLQYPRDLPWRTALGASMLTFFVLLTMAGGDDVLASDVGVSIEAFVRVFRAVVIVVPGLVFIATYLLARGLRDSGREPVKRSAIVQVKRRADGGFEIEEEEGGGFPSTEERLRAAVAEANGGSSTSTPSTPSTPTTPEATPGEPKIGV